MQKANTLNAERNQVTKYLIQNQITVVDKIPLKTKPVQMVVICQPYIFQVASLKRAASTSSATISNGRGSHSCGAGCGGKGGSQRSQKSQSQKLKARSATFSEEHLSSGVKIAHVDAREARTDRESRLLQAELEAYLGGGFT